jgi:hypothetical protein
MDDHVIVFSNDQARLVLQRRWRAPIQIEQAVSPRRNGRAVLNVVCQFASNHDPLFASNFDPSRMKELAYRRST